MALSKGESVSAEIESAYANAVIAESLPYLDKLKEIEILRKQIHRMKSHLIFANSKKSRNFKNQDSRSELLDIGEQLNQLSMAYLNHSAFANHLQQVVYQSQLSTSLHNEINKMKLSDAVDKNQDVSSILEHSRTIVDESVKWMKFDDDIRKLCKTNLIQREKYRELLKHIEKKWNILSGREDPNPLDTENTELANWQQKLKSREKNLHILIGILQGLIASSGEKFGLNERICNILRLCDTYISNPESSLSTGNVIDLLQKTREDVNHNISVVSKHKETFTSSTPSMSK